MESLGNKKRPTCDDRLALTQKAERGLVGSVAGGRDVAIMLHLAMGTGVLVADVAQNLCATAKARLKVGGTKPLS